MKTAKKKKSADDKEKAKLPPKRHEESKDEKSFDFGGLPERNLKKNLGC